MTTRLNGSPDFTPATPADRNAEPAVSSGFGVDGDIPRIAKVSFTHINATLSQGFQ
jgi:hypothetical protein